MSLSLFVYLWVWICMCLYIACVPNRIWLFVTPWTVTRQAPLSMEFFRQECWSGLPFSPPGDLPDPEIKPESLVSLALAGGFFSTSATREAHVAASACVQIHVCPSVCMSVSVWGCVHLYVYPWVCVSLHKLCVCVHVYHTVWFYMCLYVCVLACLCISVYVSVWACMSMQACLDFIKKWTQMCAGRQCFILRDLPPMHIWTVFWVQMLP